jgi:hypothetical protein
MECILLFVNKMQFSSQTCGTWLFYRIQEATAKTLSEINIDYHSVSGHTYIISKITETIAIRLCILATSMNLFGLPFN